MLSLQGPRVFPQLMVSPPLARGLIVHGECINDQKIVKGYASTTYPRYLDFDNLNYQFSIMLFRRQYFSEVYLVTNADK